MKEAIRKAIQIAGGQTELAEKAGVSQQSISVWLRKGYMPVRHAYCVEKVLNKKVRGIDLISPDDMN